MSGKVLLVVLCGLSLVLAGPAFAQEDVAAPDVTYGTVMKSTATGIVVMEYDYEQDEDIEVAYIVTAQTEFHNVGAADELSPGDPVEISYTEEGGKKIAKSVKKEVLIYEDEGVMMDEDYEPGVMNAEVSNAM